MTLSDKISKGQISLLEEKIRQAKTIAILGHQNPDGDCIGACLGLCTYILDQYPEKCVDLFLDPIKEKFAFLKNAQRIVQEKEEPAYYELCFSLDCSDPDRFEDYKENFANALYRICIDHHITNLGFGDLCLIDPKASSTCELLCRLFDMEMISEECAQALYMGIVHDTGVFKHNNTTKTTMEIAGRLLEKGINTERIIDDTFFKKTYLQNQILGRALMESMLILDGRMIFSVITKKDFDLYGIDSGDLDGIIDQLRITQGVECALLLYEKEEGLYKASMRANTCVDVSKIATMFGGGGHVKAAGCSVHGNMRDIVMNIARNVEHQLEEKQDENL